MDLADQSLGNICHWLHGARTEHQQLKLHHYLQFVLNHKKSISVKNKGYESEHTHAFEHMRANGFSIGCSGRPVVSVHMLIRRTVGHRTEFIALFLLQLRKFCQ